MKNNNKVTGNTLDYYNDDMSRKAVGRLFDGIEEGREELFQDTAGIVVGYDDAESVPGTAYEREPTPGTAYEREPTPGTAYERKPTPVESAVSEPEIYTRDPAMERAIERASELATGSSPTDRGSESGHTRSRVFAQDYDMSMYRRNKNISDEEEYQYEEIIRPRRRERNPEPAVIRRAPAPEEPSRRRSPRKPEPEEYIERAQVQRDRDEILRAANAHRRTKTLQPYIAGIFVILMIALALLLFRINSLNTRLAEAEEKQDELNTSIEHYMSVQLMNEALEKEITELKAELEELKSAPVQEPQESTAAEQPTASESEIVLPTRYVVRDGDNLSKISFRFYGTPGNYEKIKEANGLTSDVVMVGQTLTIPE